MKTVFVATAILTASFSAFAGDSDITTAQALPEAGSIANGELGYSLGEPASTASSRSSKVTATMGAPAAASPPEAQEAQEAQLARTKVRAELNEAVYKGQLGYGEFGGVPTRGSMGSQTLGQ